MSKVAVPVTPEEAAGPLAIGRTYRFAKTISESDIYQFAGITGDFHPNHVDEQYMATTRYGRRIAHGALLVGFMSTVSGMICLEIGIDRPAVTYGLDRIRYIKPVFIGDTITTLYEIAQRDDRLGEIRSTVTVSNQDGAVVAVAIHILKLV
ncbi:MAG TPA: MaoC family dehydratase [Marisediminicola sp.]|nr:MaoC family dehydratase [Marisediminicola sp.]